MCLIMYSSREQHMFRNYSEKLKYLRLFITKRITQILLQASRARTWGIKLFYLVVEIEINLYNQASSEEDYMNLATLQRRVAAECRKMITAGWKFQVAAPATGNLPPTVALGDMNVMKSTGSEANNKHLNMPGLQSKPETPVMNSWIPLHADPVQLKSVNTWTDAVKSECRDDGIACSAEDGWHYRGTLEDILHPPKKRLKLSSDETSQPLEQNMRQPPGVRQQFDVLHCVGGPSSQLTGYLEDITNHPPKNLDTVKHLSFSDSCDSNSFEVPQDELQLNPDSKYGCYVPPLAESREVVQKISDKDTRVDGVRGSDSGKQKVACSLTELLTLEQIEEHITSLRMWADQTKAKVAKNGEMLNPIYESSCQVCTMGHLNFVTSVYCSVCALPIKHNSVYYAELDADMTYRVCTTCHRNMRSRGVTINGHCIHKSKMKKIMNNQEIEEQWVGCDKCNGWQHQVCALFNDKKNENKEAPYICPECYMQEIKSGERVPLPHDAVPGAKDLPTTRLSEYIEKRLLASLKKEREERAKATGKRIDEVPGAEDLVVRVVLSVEKKSKVKKSFLEVFEEKNYPKEFPYRSKVILLFQKIDGVEVCLFAMYVQEYGSQCAFPNQGCVYISYLDSVRFFRPEVKTVNGEALRTFAYHEILIGYLDYCKSRGFRTCYLWACPPLKGDDYILYCHPEIQKAPTIGKLQKWYEAMLQNARKENVVVAVTDLYKYFFEAHYLSKSTATSLPYFDGDYWPSQAEEIINNLKLEAVESNVERKRKTEVSRRDLKDMRCLNLSESSLIDTLLMKKLGEFIFSKKDNFIMVHLQYFCTHCYQTISSGRLWSCNQCKDFRLCERCYLNEEALELKHKHPSKKKIKHTFSQVEVNNILLDPDNDGEIIQNPLFEDRQDFLNFCRKNNYQHDTLRRAKHSSMMILYYLHNPTLAASHFEND